ncbi:MAG: YbaB/EbfC family nucleoid-associated protein [Erysipelotrichaceae bacterium]|nr:YbaB/EbfC family nucleoid-associated protein [Erysipelotrichaceae bacterium]
MDLQRLLKEAQKMQSKVTKVEKELNESEYEGKNGPVAVKINGKHEVLSVEIEEDVLTAENKEMLQDMILLAFNEANAKANKDREDKMGSVTAGVSIPGVF